MKSLLPAIALIMLAAPPPASFIRAQDRPALSGEAPVSLNVRVVHNVNGKFLPDLTRDDFLVHEDGVKQEIARFDFRTAPLSLVLLFDLSPSMKSDTKRITRSLPQFLSPLRPEDTVAVMAFAKKTRLAQPLTNDRGLILSAIAR